MFLLRVGYTGVKCIFNHVKTFVTISNRTSGLIRGLQVSWKFENQSLAPTIYLICCKIGQ
jgi:hypothetical protein